MWIISEFLCTACEVREIRAPAEPPDNLARHNDKESSIRSLSPTTQHIRNSNQCLCNSFGSKQLELESLHYIDYWKSKKKLEEINQEEQNASLGLSTLGMRMASLRPFPPQGIS